MRAKGGGDKEETWAEKGGRGAGLAGLASWLSEAAVRKAERETSRRHQRDRRACTKRTSHHIALLLFIFLLPAIVDSGIVR